MSSLVNLTPHSVYIASIKRTIPPEMESARLEELRQLGEQISLEQGVNMKCTALVYSRDDAQGLPPPTEGTYYIVSTLIALSFPDRSDLLVPDGPIRDKHGRVVGCRRLAKVSYLSSLCLSHDLKNAAGKGISSESKIDSETAANVGLPSLYPISPSDHCIEAGCQGNTEHIPDFSQ